MLLLLSLRSPTFTQQPEPVCVGVLHKDTGRSVESAILWRQDVHLTRPQPPWEHHPKSLHWPVLEPLTEECLRFSDQNLVSARCFHLTLEKWQVGAVSIEIWDLRGSQREPPVYLNVNISVFIHLCMLSRSRPGPVESVGLSRRTPDNTICSFNSFGLHSHALIPFPCTLPTSGNTSGGGLKASTNTFKFYAYFSLC